MKTRLGFVSNSSSSSFVLIVPTKELDEVLDNAPAQIPFLVSRCSRTSKKAFGNKLSVLANHECTEDTWYNLENYRGDLVDESYKPLKSMNEYERVSEKQIFKHLLKVYQLREKIDTSPPF